MNVIKVKTYNISAIITNHAYREKNWDLEVLNKSPKAPQPAR